MAIVGQSLASGQLQDVKSPLYTSVGVTYEKTLCLCNTGGSTELIKLYFRQSGMSSFRIRTISLDPDQSYELTIALPMSAGDKIEGETTNSNVVDFVLGGGVS